MLKCSAVRVISNFSCAFIIGFLASTSGFADQSPPGAVPGGNPRLNDRFRPLLEKFVQEQKKASNPRPGDFMSITEIMNDRELDLHAAGKRPPVLFREGLVARTMDILVREKAPFPILVGDTGVGKTAVISQLVFDIASGNYPPAPAYQEKFDDAVVLRTNVRFFIPGGQDLYGYIDTAKFIGKSLKKKIILVFKESHFLTDYHISVLRDEVDSVDPISVILETDSKSYGKAVSGHPSFTSYAETIYVPEPKPNEIKEIVRAQAAQKAKRFKVELSDQVLDALVDVSPDYRYDIAEPWRSLTLLEDFMIAQHRKGRGETVTPVKKDLYRFVAEQLRLPVIPQNEEEFDAYMEKVRAEVKQELVGQDLMIDGMIDQFKAALKSRSRKHTVALVLGPTGVGKTLVGLKIAEKFYGGKGRFKELDMTQFKDELGLNTLFGAANGVVSADQNKGVICDFFDGPARGGGILVLNEIEEMSTEVLTRWMEIFDKGEFMGGDGKMHYIGRTLIIMTSNKNSDRILSYEAIKGMLQEEVDRRASLITQDQLKAAFTEKSSYTDESTIKAAVLERVDRLYFASPLLTKTASKVAQIEIDKYKRAYEQMGDVELSIDPSMAEILTNAFYNEALGSRQIRTAVQQVFTKILDEFKAKYGYDVKKIELSAATHPSLKTASFVTAKDPATGNTLTIEGPKIPVKNRLLDKAFRERLINLEANLKSEIFGQDEAIKAAVSALKAKYLEGGEEDVASGFFFGMTGSGKSEIAKLIAKYLYSSPKAVGLFEMGKVQTLHDVANILAPPRGVIGSDSPAQVEQFLINYPDGGVLLFDEISNAGNGNPALKETISMMFYTMMQEGYYRSPSGKIYPLDNHLILFSGNDGEQIFKGLYSDSLLEETYKEVMKNPDFTKELLSKAGFTDAFIGRLGFSVMMRPTLTAIKILIAKKMLDRWRDKVQEKQPFDIEFDPDFVKEVGILMFSAKTGARSINEFIKNVIGQLVGDHALQADWDSLLETGDRMKIKLSVSVLQPDRPFYTGDEPDKTEAILRMTMSRNGKVVAEDSIDFTNKARFKPQVHENIAKGVANHEMGHAVTSFSNVTGKKLVKITIVPEKIGGTLSALGYAQYRDVPRSTHADREYLIHYVAGLLGGSEAESMFGGSWNGGRANDVETAGKLLRRLVLESHMVPEFDAAHAYVDDKGNLLTNMPAKLKEKFDNYIEEVLADGRKLAQQTIRERWHVINAGSKFLLKYGTISEKEYEKLEALAVAMKPQMDEIIQKGWTREAADQLVIDFESIRTPDCEHALAAGSALASASEL